MLRALASTEDQLHAVVAQQLRLAIAPEGVASGQGAMWWSQETRTSSRRDRCERAARGVIAGPADIVVVHDGRHLEIELKRPAVRGVQRGGRQSTEQALHMSELVLCKAQYALCDDVPQVMAALAFWGVPFRRVA